MPRSSHEQGGKESYSLARHRAQPRLYSHTGTLVGSDACSNLRQVGNQALYWYLADRLGSGGGVVRLGCKATRRHACNAGHWVLPPFQHSGV